MAVPHLSLHTFRKSTNSPGGTSGSNAAVNEGTHTSISTNASASTGNGNSTGANTSNGSTTTNAMSDNSPIASPTTPSKRAARFRIGSLKQAGTATRNEVRANTRSDWAWPLPDARHPAEFTSLRVRPENTRFVEREPGSEDDTEGDDDDDDGGGGFAFGLSTHASHASIEGTPTRLLNGGFGDKVNGHSVASGRTGNAIYDADTDPAEARRQRRLRRRRDELQWNEGLRTFEARRNAWTGSVWRGSTADELPRSSDADGVSGDKDGLRPNGSTVHSATADDDDDDAATSTCAIDDQQPRCVPRPSLELSPAAMARHPDSIPLVPVPPPLIAPDHPVRREITPAAYAHIYSRVVVQATTPNLPVNLGDMVAVLVAGWKADDQWPPSAAAAAAAANQPRLDPLVGRRRGGGRKTGDKANCDANGSGGGNGLVSGLKKVLRISSGGGGGGGAGAGAGGGGGDGRAGGGGGGADGVSVAAAPGHRSVVSAVAAAATAAAADRPKKPAGLLDA